MDGIRHYDSPLGGITLAEEEGALAGLWFDGQRGFGAPRGLPEADGPALREAVRWLDIYFAGGVPDFTPALAPRGTAFQRAVWALLREIPYGGTVTYGELAERLAARQGGRTSARAVGGAVGRNPISLIIPCHRVIGAGGALTGYAGGLERKRRLLEMEGTLACRR